MQNLFRRTSHLIAGCYFVCGALMTLTGYLFYIDILTAATQTTLWCIVFFFASAAASAGHLTVSEIFPMEIRATPLTAIEEATGKSAASSATRNIGEATVAPAEPIR
jgi:hypothetical protein